MIFVDADAFIAWNYATDANHQRAVILYRQLHDSSEELITSWEVIDEVATKLSLFLTHKIAINFLESVFSSTIRIEYVDAILRQKVVALFAKQNSKHISLTDCANMIIARELGVKRFFSFDRHYLQNGFKLIGQL